MQKTTIGKRLAAMLLALVLLLGVCPAAAAETGAGTVVDTVLAETLDQELALLPEADFGSEWIILGLARSGRLEKGSRYFDAYYKNVVAYVNKQAAKVNKNGALHPVKCTENSRLIIALSALGRDVTRVGSWNLAAPYEDFGWISGQGLNSVVFTLIALDAAGYDTQAGDTRQRCLTYILNRQLPDGGWAYQEEAKSADPDMTAMTLQALAGYMDQDRVRMAADRAVVRLSAMQNDDGSYTSYEAVNSESTAQVIVACTALGIDPHTDARFVKNGVSAVEALLHFYDAKERGFHHVMTDKDGVPTGVDGMATCQAAYAMTAYQRFAGGKTALYDMSDVVRDCADDRHSFGDWTETAATCTQPGVRTRTCTVCGRSQVEELSPALGHHTGDGYEMDDDRHWLVCTVCAARVQEELHRYGGDQCAVCGYHKLGGRIRIVPLTAVPQELQNHQTLSSVAAIEEALLASTQRVSRDCTRANSQLLDVTLLIPSAVDGKTVWTPAGKDAFPANGKITVLLPYPQGTGANGYDFVVTHLFTNADFGKTPGGVESPKVKKTADGLLVTVTGLSPMMISWHASSGSVFDRVFGGVGTGDGSQPALWLCGLLLPAAAVAVLTQKKKRSAR